MFFLGVHRPNWLATAGVPLFVSRRTLEPYRTLPRAIAPWALDSGGFTELAMHGRWTVPARAYASAVRRFRDEVGFLQWAAPQDWMCEPQMLARTGLTVLEHQRLTIDNYLELRAIAPDLPFIPVLQGWGITDYWRHAEAYDAAGIRLDALPLVGVGTVCRRQHTSMACALLQSLSRDGLKLHGFGLKLQGLRAGATYLKSADSMAWSYSGRRNPPRAQCAHKNCANCLPYALEWRDRIPGVLTPMGDA